MKRPLKQYTRECGLRNKTQENIPVYSVTNSHGFVPSTDYFSKEVYSKDLSNYKIVSRGMIAYNPSRVNVGSLAVQNAEDKVIVSPLYVVFSVDESELMPEYVSYFLHSERGIKEIVAHTSGSVRDSLKFSALQDIEINICSLNEQAHIVSLLQKIERIIEKRRSVLVKIDDLVKSQFIEMFEKGQQYEETFFGDVCLYVRNGANIKQSKGAGGYPITRIETLSNDVFNSDRLGYADITDLSRYTNYLLKKGDILISHINSIAYLGRAVQYRGEVASPVIHGMNLLCARMKEGYNPTYIEWYLKSKRAKDYIATITKKAVNQASITTSDLKKMAIPVPTKEKQDQFACFVEQTDKSKVLLAIELFFHLYTAICLKAFEKSSQMMYNHG